jgi:hypothetical protein
MSYLSEFIFTALVIWLSLGIVMMTFTWITAKVLKALFPYWWQRNICVDVDQYYDLVT